MSLTVPLALRVGNRHLTAQVESVGFRKEAIGGVRSISFRLSRPLSTFDPDFAAYSDVYIYDARTAECIAQGRLADTGRGAGNDGQSWEVVAFGPVQHASDRTFPYVVITQSLESFRRGVSSTKNATTGTDERSQDVPSILHTAEQGKTVSTSWVADSVFWQVKEAGMKLGSIYAEIDAGVTDANYIHRLITRTDAGAETVARATSASTTSSSFNAHVTSEFTNGHNVFTLRTIRNTSATTGAETHWFEYFNVYVRTLLLNADGTERASAATYDLIQCDPHEVVNDLLGRVLTQFDGAGATVDTGGTYNIDQMSYPDGVTAEQVLADLMVLEPAYRWTTGPDTGSGYSFSWEPWPTTVRYEATLDDGGDFPVSTTDLYNEVVVRWRLKDGRVRTTTRTLACAILDDAGVTRTAQLDLGDEIGSVAQATAAGDNYLAEHNVPRNAGTLTIARPIRDLVSGGAVDPHQIEPGELIRVNGVESYPDSLNADSSDGRTVFRIWAVNYSSDSGSAQLELDSDDRSTAAALAALKKQKVRRRR